MTVIAGLWRHGDRPDGHELARAVSGMLDAQIATADVGKTVRMVGSAAFGRAGFSLPGCNVASGPRAVTSDHILLSADARIDNRAELFELLARRDDPSVDDETLILLAFERWGEGVVDRLLGDFAIAAWEPARQTVTLIRDPTGQRPLHYRITSDAVAIASLPSGLFVGVERPRVDAARLAQFLTDGSAGGPGAFFAGIGRVEPAQVVRIERGGTQSRIYWQMPAMERRYRTDQDYVDAYREQLDRATQARLRGAGGIVAAHLSAGMDSGAVAATAARLRAPGGGRVLGITSAPRAGFDGPAPERWIADESAIAATVAAHYPNLDHLVLRSDGTSPIDYLDGDAMLVGQPFGHPCNNVWWQRANAAAHERGARVMLTGEMGNLTISAGGIGALADLIRSGDIAAWLRTVVTLHGTGPRWRGLMAASFSPWLPQSVLTLLNRLSAGRRGDSRGAFLRETAVAAAPKGTSFLRQGDQVMRWNLLRSGDPGNFRKSAWLRWGIDERDPTADRRLIEFCFSLPPSQLLRGGQTRRLARIALSDRLPAVVLQGVRGYQYADWYEALDRDRLAAFCDRIAADPVAADVIDLPALRHAIAQWPPGNWASPQTLGTYRVALLRALSVGAFALKAGR